MRYDGELTLFRWACVCLGARDEPADVPDGKTVPKTAENFRALATVRARPLTPLRPQGEKGFGYEASRGLRRLC